MRQGPVVHYSEASVKIRVL